MSYSHSLNAGYEVETHYVCVEVCNGQNYLCAVSGNIVVILSVFSQNGSEVIGECVAVALFEDVKLCM